MLTRLRYWVLLLLFPAVPEGWMDSSALRDPSYYERGRRQLGLVQRLAMVFYFVMWDQWTFTALVMVVSWIGFSAAIGMSTASFQKDQRYLIGGYSAWALCFCSWDTFALVAVAGLWRFMYSDCFGEMVRAPNSDGLRMKGCRLHTPNLMSAGAAGQVDPRFAGRNMCAWDALFAEPREAQRRMCGRSDGRMSAHLLEVLARNGLAHVYTFEGYVDYGHRNNAPRVYAANGHTTPDIPELVQTMVTATPYDSEPLGLILPGGLPPPALSPVGRTELVEAVSLLRAGVASDNRRTASLAEMGLAAALEDLDVYDKLLSVPALNDLTVWGVRRLYLCETDWHVYDRLQGRWLFKPTGPLLAEPPSVGWDGFNLVDIEWQAHRPAWDSSSRYLLAIEGYKYKRGTKMAMAVVPLLDEEFESRVILDLGVPGCGKTTFIKNNYRITHLILVVGTLMAAALRLEGFDAQTIDSFICNGCRYDKVVDTVWVDEALLTHGGSLVYVERSLKPDDMRAAGDYLQLPVYSQTNAIVLRYHAYAFTNVVLHSLCWRNPVVIVDMLAPLYAAHGRAYICAHPDRLGSVDVVHISSYEGVKRGYGMYLTFRQDERGTMRQNCPWADAHTIHQRQGDAADTVALVRLKVNDLDIYKSICHQIVALSRTRYRFCYFTVDPNDDLACWIRRGKTDKTFVPVEKEPFKLEPFAVCGGVFTPVIEKVTRLVDAIPASNYDEWMAMNEHVGPLRGTDPLDFCWRSVVCEKVPFHSVGRAMDRWEFQCMLDVMYHRRDLDIAAGDRMDFPVKWPRSVVVDIVKSVEHVQLEPRLALTNLIVSPQPERAQAHPLDGFIAFDKRVLHVVQLKTDYAPERAILLADGVFRQVNPTRMKGMLLGVPTACERVRARWWNRKGFGKQQPVLTCDIVTLDGTKYYCLVRPDHKPKLDGSHTDGLPAGQLVTAQHPFWTAMFAAIFAALTIAMKGSFNDNIVMNTLCDWEELGAFVDNLLSGEEFCNLELDISKYDKSQDRAMLEAQCIVMRRFGVEEWVVDLWKAFHELCRLSGVKMGITAFVGFSRRTGDALTWIGNTMVLLMVLAYLYPIEKALLVLIGGDDNNTCFPLGIKVGDESERAASELNFEVKTFCFRQSMYFSSRFIVCPRFGWLLAPDPVKLLVRLGRSDLQGREHIEAIHASWQELCYMYHDPEVRHLVAVAAESRYSLILKKTVPDMLALTEAISAITADVEEMVKLFGGSDKAWALKLDPGERVGGGFYDSTPWAFDI